MKRIFTILGITIAGFLLIQLVPYGRNHSNPAVVAEPKWDSPQTRALAVRACFDCHSNETTWPWYSRVAPVSWLVQRDVDEGRATMNLSEWGATQPPSSDREREQRARDAKEIGQTILRNRMPPAIFLIMHPDANLTQEEREQLANGFQIMLTGAK